MLTHKFLEKLDIPDGIYEAVWIGYEIRANCPGEERTWKTKISLQEGIQTRRVLEIVNGYGIIRTRKLFTDKLTLLSK